MITVKQVYDAYPSSDLLAFTSEITDQTTLEDLEAMADAGLSVGDTLFMFICRELCRNRDAVDEGEGRRRIGIAIQDLIAVADKMGMRFESTIGDAAHVAKLLATHLFSLTQMQPGETATYSLGLLKGAVKCQRPGEFMVDGKAVGNLYGAMEVYTRLVLTVSKLLMVVPHG